ncbi:hypothetical protein, partial [Campylobacter jejuni]|uniref:hypothetical protein n=1 Tax=Campylobacter jejuni TaxID=197 RepID=UPI001E2EDCDE
YLYQALIYACLHPVKPQGSFFIMIDISEMMKIGNIRNEMPPIVREWWNQDPISLLKINQLIMHV